MQGDSQFLIIKRIKIMGMVADWGFGGKLFLRIAGTSTGF